MEALEIIVYITIAIIVGGLMVLVVKTTDFQGAWKSFTKTFHGENQVYKVKFDGIAQEIEKRWVECRYGLDNLSYSLYIEEEGMLTREFIVRELQKRDSCDVIDCRNRTGKLQIAESIQAPKILNIRCFNESLIIS